MTESGIYKRLQNYIYYFIIGILSIIVLGFFPLIGSEINADWKLPNTTVGWVVWIFTKIIVAGINILIFFCFMEQGKINVSNNEKYIKAKKILVEEKKEKEKVPISPQKWESKQYTKKGIFLFITSILSAVAFSQAILTYDWATFISYIFVIIMGVIFGIIQMKKVEYIWTDEYLEYALYIENKNKTKTEVLDDNNRQ